MKILSVVIPCYNSEAYMDRCVHSLLTGGNNVEIIIVDDGSTDGTVRIADKYAEDYPDIVNVVHQENGGHGEAINTGLRHATGMFFKVVDSDDWVSVSAYREVLKMLECLVETGRLIDMLVTNFVYEKEGAKRKKTMKCHGALPKNRVFTWDDIGHFRKGQYILMHSAIFRTELLRECRLQLLKHTFYVDNIFVYHPLPYVKTMYYLDVDFYRYYIGRADQSVNESVMIRRINQQLTVNYHMIDAYNLTFSPLIKSRKQRHYMRNYLEIIMVISSIMLIRSGSSDNLQKKKALWRYLKHADEKTYYFLRWSILGVSMNLPGKYGRKLSETAYKLAQQIVGFN